MSAEPLSEDNWIDVQYGRGNYYADFPSLIRAECRKTDDEDTDYNCIGWAMGRSDQWIIPPPTDRLVDELSSIHISRPSESPSADV